MASNWSLLELVRLRASQINGERPTRCIGRGAVASVRRVTDATSFQLSVTLRFVDGTGVLLRTDVPDALPQPAMRRIGIQPRMPEQGNHDLRHELAMW
jgi:hypothetical protein